MLENVQVVEIEGLGPAPFAAMWLADLGAEVTVIHRPGPGNAVSGGRNLLDRGKRSIVLNLKDAADLDVARALIGQADALIEGFRPGVMEKLGLGPKEMRARNPRLVYGRMTGWGQEGPRAHTAGHDLNYLSVAGALWYGGLPGQAPLPPPTLLGDVGGGAAYLVAGVLAGLLRAARTGQGTVVDAAIVDGAAHMMALLLSLQGSGNLAEERGQSLLDAPPWGRVYACAEGWLSVQCLEPQFYAIFLDRLGLEGDPLFARQMDRALWPRQAERLAGIFAGKAAAEWEALFAGTDACVAKVQSPWDARAEPHMAARDIWQEQDGLLSPAPAPRFDGVARVAGEIPARGAHGESIRKALREKGLIA